MKKLILLILLVNSAVRADGLSPEFLESLRSLTSVEKSDKEKATANAPSVEAGETSPFEVPVMEDPKGKVQNGVIYLRRVPFQNNSN